MIYVLLAILLISLAVNYAAANKARVLSAALKTGAIETDQKLHSLPFYHGIYNALMVFLPALIILGAWAVFSGPFIEHSLTNSFSSELGQMSQAQQDVFVRDARAIAEGGIASQTGELQQKGADYYGALSARYKWLFAGLSFFFAALSGIFAYRQISVRFRARNRVEKILRRVLAVMATVAILTTIGIVFSLVFETFRFFQKVSPIDFFFGTHWSPQVSIRPGQVASEGAFGFIPLMSGTLLITFIAMMVAVPIGLLTAIYLSEYASNKFRSIAKPLLEILAGIPTVVYGFFAALTVAPLIRGWGEGVGLSIASESALAAGLVMGIMIIPIVSSLSDDVINSVPQRLRDGAMGLGATKSETIRQVVLPAALPGIVSAVLLAVSRAIGETMIVVMAAGLAAKPMSTWSEAIAAFNPLEAVTTITVQMATLLVGDQEFNSAKTLAAFALGLTLFCITLALNILALRIVRKYREQYD